MWNTIKTVFTGIVILYTKEGQISDYQRFCPAPCTCSSTWMNQVTVNCSDRNLDKVPHFMQRETHRLLLDGNQLTSESLEGLHLLELPELSHLNLSNNMIQSINACTLDSSKFSNLKVLDVSNNQLTEVPSSLPKSVEVLHLGQNEIEDANLDVLMHIQHLVVLDLRNNEIDSIFSEQGTVFMHLRRLVLSSNRISKYSLSQIDWSLFPSLESLSMANNEIHEIPNSQFISPRNLKVLDLRNNGMISISEDAFKILKSLVSLHLSHNKLTHVPHGYETLKHLDLSHNDIATIPSDYQYVLASVEVLNVAYNPLVCDCDVFWLKELLHKAMNSTQTPEQSEAPICTSPPNVAGKALTKLSNEDLICPSDNTQEHTITYLGVEWFKTYREMPAVICSFCLAATTAIGAVVYLSARSLDRKMSTTVFEGLSLHRLHNANMWH